MPPEAVVTIMSPLPLAGPVRAIILFGDFHSADSEQSVPHIFNPTKLKKAFLYLFDCDCVTKNPPTDQIICTGPEKFATNCYFCAWWTLFWR